MAGVPLAETPIRRHGSGTLDAIVSRRSESQDIMAWGAPGGAKAANGGAMNVLRSSEWDTYGGVGVQGAGGSRRWCCLTIAAAEVVLSVENRWCCLEESPALCHSRQAERRGVGRARSCAPVTQRVQCSLSAASFAIM